MMLKPRSSKNSASKTAPNAVKNTPRRDILDLSLFGLDADLEMAHFSLSISGFNDFTWVAYAFADETLDEENEDDEDDDDDEDEDDKKMEDDAPDAATFIMDKIAPGGALDVKMHRKDPREYFLTVIDVRFREYTEMCCDVVDTLEDNLVSSPFFQVSNNMCW
jgi:hypothetical protein